MHRAICVRVASLLAALVAGAGTVFWSLSATAAGSSGPYSQGGNFGYNDVIKKYNQSGELFRIEGYCRSSCTWLLAIKNVCVEPSATLAFHAAILHPNDTVSAAKNVRKMQYYNAKLRAYVAANHFMDSWDFHTIPGSDIIQRFGYRQCPPK